MPVKYGTTSIDTIKKGTSNIVAAYKGSVKVFESFKWLPYSFEYLYHDLIPTTISGKNVKNKAKLTKIYGESEVRNQLISNDTTSETINGITFTNNGDGSWTLSGTASATAWKSIGSPISSIYNHKVLIHGSKTYSGLYLSLSQGTSFYDSGSSFIGDFNISVAYPVIGVASGTTFTNPITIYPQTNDLTQMFPFDTPTTLTDNRVQAILNRGYIPFNSGELKSVDIGEFSSTKADTTALQTIQFKYQGSGVGTAHDSLEISSSGYVFTKNIGIYTFNGSESFVDWSGSGTSLTIALNNLVTVSSNNDVANVLWALGQTTYVNNMGVSAPEYSIAVGTSNRLYIATTKNSSQLATAIQGQTLYYQLATPQVITIPRKHLAVVDLGSLNWASTSYGVYSNDLSSLVKKP